MSSYRKVFKYSGLEFIFRKFIPKKEDKESPSGIIWIIGIYVAIYGIASNKYENKVDLLETRTAAIITLLSTDRKLAIEQLIALQNETVPSPPELLLPPTSFKTFFGSGELHPDTIRNVKTIIVGLKANLRGAKLDNVDLSEVDMSNSDLRNASLCNSILSGTDFSNSTLNSADFRNSELNKAILYGADLSNCKNITHEMISSSFIDTETKIPVVTPYPNTIKPVMIFERLSQNLESQIKSFIYKAERKFYVWISLYSDYYEGEIDILIDNKAANSLYFDDNIYGGFVSVPYSMPGFLKISGDPIRNEFYTNFDWELRHTTAGYHDIGWNYRDDFQGDKFLFYTKVNEPHEKKLSLNDTYFNVEPEIIEESPDGIIAIIPRGRGNLLGIQYKEHNQNNYKYCIEFLSRFAEGDSKSKLEACRDGAFLLVNVPEFRKDYLMKYFEPGEVRFIFHNKILGDSRQ